MVPPGFVPDPNYTWVPRSRVQAPPPTATYTPTPTPTPPPTTTTPPPVTTTTTTPFQLPEAAVPAAAALLPAQRKPVEPAACTSAARARSGADFVASRKLISLAREIRGYTGVP